MAPAPSSGYISPPARLAAFLRDFLPEQNLQLLFPLGSFLLLLGVSHAWYRLELPGLFETLRQRDFKVEPDSFRQFTHSYAAWVQIEEQIAQSFVRFAFFASLILWGLPARKIVSKFVKWVFLPAGFALVGFQVLLIATRQQRNAFFDAFTVAANVPVPTMRPWFLTLGEGIYLSLGGLLVLAGALILVRQQKVSLPLRFRRSAQAASAHDAETVRDARDVFVFLIVMAVWTLGVSFLLFAPVLIRGYWSWHYGNFDFLEWVPALVNAAAAACIALIFLRKTRRNALDLLLPKRPPRDYALAVAIPLVVVLIPRFLLGALFQPDRWTPGPSQLFIPHPLPWVLAIFVIAFFEEFAVRGYLQTTLEQYLSLNRSIFVTGLLWRLLPMGFGMTHSLVEAKDYALVPGLPYLTSLATLLIYSVPLGWLYARTRSVVAVALMHGTIAVFHVGLGDKIHLNRPEFYWLELALWIFIGWYLMGERRYVMPSVQRT